MKIKRLNIYIARQFLIRFFQTIVGFSLLIFLINFLDVIEKVKDSDASISEVCLMSFLQIGDFLNEIVSSLVLISATTTFFFLSSKSEITIARSSGFSIWQVLQPVAISAIFLGIIWIIVFNPISVMMVTKYNSLEDKYVRKEHREMVAPSNGIWLKQINAKNPKEEIIFQAKKVYKNTLEMKKITFWFFDENGQFYKKINAENMFLKDGFWILQDVVVNDSKELNKNLKNYSIETNLEAEFITQTILNNFQNVKLFSIFQLPSLIEDLQNSGFSSIKFKVYLNSLLSKPLFFLSMSLIACYFGINHSRNNRSIFMMFLGISFGLILYIVNGIINVLGSSGLIPIFASTWVVAIICSSIGILLIYQKEKF